MNRRIVAVLLAVVMTACIMLTGCTGSEKDVTKLSIANVSEETVTQITSDMTKQQVYELLGETNGSYITGKNGFLATYIVDSNYIYSISVNPDDTGAIGYDGTAVMNSLKLSRSLKTDNGAVVKAESNYVAGSGDGFAVNVDYSGSYTCSMSGYTLFCDGSELLADDELTGSKKIIVDVLNPEEEAANTTAADSTAAAAVIVPQLLSVGGSAASEKATTEGADLLVATAPSDDDDSAKETTAGDSAETTAATDGSMNELLGMLKITTDAGENIYVEIYSVGGQTFISRVRL